MLALAQDLLAAGIALAAYAFGAWLAFARYQRLTLPFVRTAPLPKPSNNNEACRVRAASGR